MKKNTILGLLFTAAFSFSGFSQNKYQVNTSGTNVKEKSSEKWMEPIRYNTLKPGLRFMILEMVPSTPNELSFKTKTGEKISAKDFENEIFIYKNSKEVPDKYGYDKTLYYFENKGKEYYLEELKTDNEEKIVNWDASSVVWLDEIDAVQKKLEGKSVWLNADRWGYELNGKKSYMHNPERFAKIKVLKVGVGMYSNYPVRVLFENESDGKHYFIDGCVSGTLGSCFSSANLQQLFLFENPEKIYPNVSKDFWSAIKNRQIKKGMSEEECTLSLGKPSSKDAYQNEKGTFKILFYEATMYRRIYTQILLKDNKVTEMNEYEN
ncbi:hypothetical protein MG290_02995 [Flavobacterium sp. CBA20B-1]|uniref:hypothetical protein n=1 Tax=unclassified Flavobacterium TaxID=196869 RepID=UPI0022252F3D|nr:MULTISPECIES: hypothetical protein [unclassified Flavobacterium]WCM42659.1 hypothetical protein MG290_02995 [Flavobacterium sp. CBA20B-1]